MKKINIYINFILLSIFSIGCEKVIQVDLNESDPRLVVEGNITTNPGPYVIQLTQTENYFDRTVSPKVTGATVTISDDAGNTDLLIEQEDGMYYTQTIQGVPGRTYTLDIESNGERYTATATMSHSVTIDSSFVYYNDGSISVFAEEGFYLQYSFIDPIGTDYYRLQTFSGSNLDKVEGRRGEFFDESKLGTDNSKESTIWFDPFLPFNYQDTITVVVSAIDKTTYDYYIGIQDSKSSNGGGFGSIPQNPPSNISNNALGFFGALAQDKKTIVIEF